ncbi:hypothetical protein V8E52_009337 [Russula decolorans]
MDVVVCPADLLVSQVEIDLKPLQGLHLASVSAAWAALAPSSVAASVGKYKQEQVDHPIFDGRPMATLSIFWVFPLIILLGHKERSNWKPTEADAVVRGPIEHESFVNKTVVLACVELKNELGIRGDGGLKAALSLRRYVAQEHYDDIRNASCCPSSLRGGVSCPELTAYIYMGGDPFKTEQAYYVAKMFDAVTRAVKALQREYFFLKPQPQPGFRSPSPTCHPNSPLLGSPKFSELFMYEGRHGIPFPGLPKLLLSATHLVQLWLANIPHSGYISPEAMVAHRDSYRRSLFLTEYQGKTVVVKFCERYGEDAHRAPADAGLAPIIVQKWSEDSMVKSMTSMIDLRSRRQRDGK